ncbi:MAG: fumarylacetoacetate hydrolase family protein [Prosthecochloris sp.]|uniref:Fumarylacetoacetate (FAA) hydrolase n=1 Tax=Prosthecochloris aestuarii (strain DSM 271 / SK 413) TaxID=290512 RepID=B4S7P1_PROA2|nr:MULTISPECIES: fumarylacetoacetate hydrolase family protein [Prosthecochloris]ACF46078.1 fumarylacetoacetate (FAA) hydrolase [Prosthecochloris aestuarii DSM 271]MCW8798147.1 fumarylacetoacetate hydrolase family protein [Prosthecochloris sp.]RDD30408.1 FAA hydrolase family protein [Prosthecochloris sp. ZM]
MPLIPAATLAPSSIYCVGKNYEDHAREMLKWDGGTTLPPLNESDPIIFLKPVSALTPDYRTSIPCIEQQPVSHLMHYEAELVLLIGKDAEQIGLDEAPRYIQGYGVGLDMTLRDVQQQARQKGEPWLKSKGFRQSAMVSDIITAEDAGDPASLGFSLILNGKKVQQGAANQMIFNPFHLISYLSWIYGLRRGDLLFTGTPAGVGPVEPGDRLEAILEQTHNGAATALTHFEATIHEPGT